MTGENKDWHKIINDLNSKVDKLASKYTNVKALPSPITTQTLVTYQPTVVSEPKKSIFSMFESNKIIKILSFFGGTFLICFLILFILKPNFVIKKVKNEKTFFVENKVNYKLILILSVCAGIAMSFLIYKFTRII